MALTASFSLAWLVADVIRLPLSVKDEGAVLIFASICSRTSILGWSAEPVEQVSHLLSKAYTFTSFTYAG